MQESLLLRIFSGIIGIMILGAIDRDGDIGRGRVFRSVSMPGDKGRTEVFPVRFHEWSDLVCGQVFRRIKKVERIPAHGQQQVQFFDGTQITHHAYRIRLLKEDALGTGTGRPLQRQNCS